MDAALLVCDLSLSAGVGGITFTAGTASVGVEFLNRFVNLPNMPPAGASLTPF